MIGNWFHSSPRTLRLVSAVAPFLDPLMEVLPLSIIGPDFRTRSIWLTSNQASSGIDQACSGSTQAQPWQLRVYSGYTQAQSWQLMLYSGSAQAESWRLMLYSGSTQAQSWQLTLYSGTILLVHVCSRWPSLCCAASLHCARPDVQGQIHHRRGSDSGPLNALKEGSSNMYSIC